MQQNSAMTSYVASWQAPHTVSCNNPTCWRQRHVAVSLISPAALIGELFEVVEVKSNIFDKCWKCVASELTWLKNTSILRAPLFGTMASPLTIKSCTMNVDYCRCLVVTHMPSILSAFCLYLLNCIHLHRSSIQAEHFWVSPRLEPWSKSYPKTIQLLVLTQVFQQKLLINVLSYWDVVKQLVLMNSCLNYIPIQLLLCTSAIYLKQWRYIM